jgi:hypothetical protein
VSRESILALDGRGLAAAMARGHRIDEAALDDSQYRGISLGLPRAIEAVTWKTFRKAFHRDPRTGALRGWNVRLAQTGVDGPSRPLATFGHFGVAALGRTPRPCGPGLLLDYGQGSRGPLGRLRDPIVALHDGSVELLLGWSYLELGLVQLATPSYFLLEREGRLDEVAPPRW